MATEPKNFDLGDVLSITTEILLSPRLINGIYDILGFMTGESLFTHQLSAAANECAPVLLEQHPQLKEIVVPELNPESAMAWLRTMKDQFGETLLVTPLNRPPGMYSDPLGDLRAMMDKPPILVRF